jgi:hypothetical protein
MNRRIMIHSQFPYLRSKALFGGVLGLTILAVVGCAHTYDSSDRAYKEYRSTRVATVMFASEEIAHLTPDEESLVRFLASRLFDQAKLKAEARGRKYTYYLKVLGKNPDPGILKDLQDENVRLKPASEGMLLDDRVYDPGADWAEMYSISKIEISDGVARVEAGFFLAPLSAIDYEYHMIRKGETWEIARSKMLRIS